VGTECELFHFNYYKVIEGNCWLLGFAIGVWGDKVLENRWIPCKILRTICKKEIYTENKKKVVKAKKGYL